MGRVAGALLVCLAALASVRAQITEPGICPFSIPLADWDEEQFVSEPWYEIKAFTVPGLHDSLRPGCTRWHFSSSPDGQGLHARLAYRAREGDAAVRAFAQYTTAERHPRFNLTFHDLGGSGLTRSVHMKLVATDYDDFALMWGCTEPNLFERKVVSWVLSRRPFLSENAQEALRSLFRAHDIRTENYVETNHDDQTCGVSVPGAFGPAEVTVLPEDTLDIDSQTESVFAPYRKLDQDANDVADYQGDQQGDQAMPMASEQQGVVNVQDDDGSTVSASYVGSGWLEEALGAQGMMVAVLLALALVSLIASLLTFRALMHRLQRQRGCKPVLPVHRQDVVVATLGLDSGVGVDYSRFGGLSNVQTRKHAAQGFGVDLAPRA